MFELIDALRAEEAIHGLPALAMQFMRDSKPHGLRSVSALNLPFIFVPNSRIGCVYLVIEFGIVDVQLLWTDANNGASVVSAHLFAC